ncbi:TATA element modulatory factor 1 [Borealophlyctis nickersoniae]|nr:TATA element modulatory factor 1 [Borealophlyctis nickersoniae]
MSWLSNITSSENAQAWTGLLKQAVQTVESRIDKVLDIPPTASSSPTITAQPSEGPQPSESKGESSPGSTTPNGAPISSQARQAIAHDDSFMSTRQPAPVTEKDKLDPSPHPSFREGNAGERRVRGRESERTGGKVALERLPASGGLATTVDANSNTKLAMSRTVERKEVDNAGDTDVNASASLSDEAANKVERGRLSSVQGRGKPGVDLEVLEQRRDSDKDAGDSGNLIIAHPRSPVEPSLETSMSMLVELASSESLGHSASTSLSEADVEEGERIRELDEYDGKPDGEMTVIGAWSPTRAQTPSESESPAPPSRRQQPEPSPFLSVQLEKEVEKYRQIIDQRERQLMTAMEENASLTDTVNVLRSQLEQLELARGEESAKVQQEMRELTDRLGVMDKQFKTIVKERDALRRSATSSQGSLRAALDETSRQLELKEEAIRGLMAEGEKLSKVEMKHLTTIKKMRAKEAETDRELKSLGQKLEDAAGEIAELKQRVAILSETEKKQADTICGLASLNEQQAKQLIKSQDEASTLKDRHADLQSTLDRAWKDLAEVRKQQADGNAAAASEALDKEIRANEELHKQLEVLQRQNEGLEASLRRETLQKRLQIAEARNEDLSAANQEATRPLIRQYEMLQAQFNAATRSWEEMERSLTLRLRQAEADRTDAVDRERSLLERLHELSSRISSLEAQVSHERQENSRLALEMEAGRKRAIELEEVAIGATTKLEHAKAEHVNALEDAKENYQRMLHLQLEKERERQEEKQKSDDWARQNRELDKQKLRLDIGSRRTSYATSPGPIPRRDSSAALEGPSSSFTRVNSMDSPGGMMTGLTPAAVIERLHSSVKQLEGQISSLQTQLQMATQTRDGLADELVKLTNENETMWVLCVYSGSIKQLCDSYLSTRKATMSKLQSAEKEKEDLNIRYLAALELLGEKTEQADELRADIQDMKDAFRVQVTELLAEVDMLRRGKDGNAKAV